MSETTNNRSVSDVEDLTESEVFYGEKDPPPKPPRIFAYEENYFKKPGIPAKPPRKMLPTDTDLVDFSSLKIEESNEFTHLTKNRAALPKRRLPERYEKVLNNNYMNQTTNLENNLMAKIKNIEKTVTFFRSQKTQSLDEFSVLRRKAIRRKTSK